MTEAKENKLDIRIIEKLNKLEAILKSYSPILVAFSGGVDSTFLLAFAYKIFDGDSNQIGALTAIGPQFAKDEIKYAESFCDGLGISHKKIDASHIINMIKRNPIDRCYHCKRELFGILKERTDMVGSGLVDGTNADDMKDYRPGYEAVCQLGVKSPLKEAGLTKDEIRQALKTLDIGDAKEMASHPAFACLVTRIPYGETVSEKKLEAIYKGEEYLKGLGFKQVRVRCHEIAGKISGNETRFMARIELENEDMARFLGTSSNNDTCFNQKSILNQRAVLNSEASFNKTESTLKEFGFEYVTLDLGGYQKGKMNNIIEGHNKSGIVLEKPDRIKVTETARRGNAENVETADIMAEIDRFLKETRDKEYSFCDFVNIIEQLRKPGGCPWDREQTHESLKKHMVEEVNETLEAIDEKDWKHLCEELGDVLLQIVLHSQIAKEAGEFTMDEVIQCASEKMIRRHPHVFGNIDVSGVDEGLDLWEEIKKREKMQKQEKIQKQK